MDCQNGGILVVKLVQIGSAANITSQFILSTAHLLLGGWEVGRWDKYWFPADSPLTPPHDRKVELQEALHYCAVMCIAMY